MEQVSLTHSQIRYIMNLMMGDYHSSQTRLYNHLESHLDDMSLEQEAARLEVTVDELYTMHARRDLDAL
jgi:hypothetical protein